MPRTPMSKLPNALSLRRFLLRQQVLNLYREYMRLIKEVGDEKQRHELREWVRQDFDANRHHTEEEIIKMHLSRGRKALKQVGNTVALPRIKS